MSDEAPLVVTGYMCLTDFKYELGKNTGGNIVFPSIDALKRHFNCWESCGIVEVKVRRVCLVHEGTGQ